MTRSRTKLLLVFALISCAFHANAESWRIYHNTRFGATAQIPANWSMDPAPENNDGRSFTSPDKRAKIVIAGIFAGTPRPDEDIALRAKPNDGEVVTYEKRGIRWIVVSGTKGNVIFYRKSILTCGNSIWNDFSIEYPFAEKEKYDALVKHVAASLHGGNGYDAEECG